MPYLFICFSSTLFPKSSRLPALHERRGAHNTLITVSIVYLCLTPPVQTVNRPVTGNHSSIYVINRKSVLCHMEVCCVTFILNANQFNNKHRLFINLLNNITKLYYNQYSIYLQPINIPYSDLKKNGFHILKNFFHHQKIYQKCLSCKCKHTQPHATSVQFITYLPISYHSNSHSPTVMINC